MSINKDRGLEELALAIALDLEPVDPPDNLEDKILSKIKAEEAPPKEFILTKLWKKKTFRLALSTTAASLSCVVLAALYWSSLHENERLKEEVRLASSINTDELTQTLGRIEKVMPLQGKEGAKGKAFVLKTSDKPDSKNEPRKRVVFVCEGIKKKDDEVVQVWVKDSPKDGFRPAGVIEPKDGVATFSTEVREDISEVMITLETSYNKSPQGKVLLASTPPPHPDSEINKESEKTNKGETDTNSSSESKVTTPSDDKPTQVKENEAKPTDGTSSGTQENPTNMNPVEPAPNSSAKPSPPDSGATPPDGGTSPQYQSNTTLTE